MTTVLGVYFPDIHKDFAVLVGDRQSTFTDGNMKFTGKNMSGRKLFMAPDGSVLAHAGTRMPNFLDFISGFTKGEYDLEKAVSEGHFPELREMNMARIEDTDIKDDQFSYFLLMTRFDKQPRLHYCHSFGKVQDTYLHPLGSGAEKVYEYDKARRVNAEVNSIVRHENLGAPSKTDIIQYAIEALAYAQGTDLYSSGFDMAIMEPTKTNDHFSDLQDNLMDRIERIQKGYIERKDSQRDFSSLNRQLGYSNKE